MLTFWLYSRSVALAELWSIGCVTLSTGLNKEINLKNENMITEIKMWTANCDSCNVNYELWDGCVALNEKTAISNDIKESGEWVMTRDDKIYCSDCHQTCWDDEKDENQVFSKDTQNSGAVFLGIED